MNINILESDLINFLPFFIATNEGQLVYCNKLFAQLMEYEPEEIIGQKMSLFKSGMHTEEFYRDLWSTLKNKKTWRGTFCNLSKSQKHVWLDTIIIPYENAKGSGFYGFRIDKSREVKLEKNNFELSSRLSRRLDSGNTQHELYLLCQSFLHTLNNPLTIFDLNYHYIKNKLINVNELEEKYKRQLIIIDESIEKLKKVGSAFSNIVSSGQSGGEISFLQLMENVVIFLQDISNSRKLDFSWERNSNDEKLHLTPDVLYLLLGYFDLIRNLDLKKRGTITICAISENACVLNFSTEEKLDSEQIKNSWENKNIQINKNIQVDFEVSGQIIKMRISHER